MVLTLHPEAGVLSFYQELEYILGSATGIAFLGV